MTVRLPYNAGRPLVRKNMVLLVLFVLALLFYLSFLIRYCGNKISYSPILFSLFLIILLFSLIIVIIIMLTNSMPLHMIASLADINEPPSLVDWFIFLFTCPELACNFEDGLCGWYQDTCDNFDWMPLEGMDHTVGIGQRKLHTCTRGEKRNRFLFTQQQQMILKMGIKSRAAH